MYSYGITKEELVEHIKDEILGALVTRKSSNESDDAYWIRKSKGILDMIEGFTELDTLSDPFKD